MKKIILGAVATAAFTIAMNVANRADAHFLSPKVAAGLHAAIEAQEFVIMVRSGARRGGRPGGHARPGRPGRPGAHYRPGRPGYPGHYRPGYPGYVGGAGPWYGNDWWNPGVIAAGVGGAMLGAAAVGSGANVEAVDSCARRYVSYDRASRTYLGNDGRRHNCP